MRVGSCHACHAEVAPSARFCGACGAPVAVVVCPSCEAPVQVGQRFCSECGGALGTVHPIPTREADPAGPLLKKVTVLFCDIVGSTGLAERLGPEAMHGLLERFFQVALSEVHRYGGTVNKFLGDGFMALVGVPQAHEDHARRAALAALGIRRRLGDELVRDAPGERVRVRMGLHSGAVVVGRLGDGLEEDFTAVGDTINVAARLQASAEPDEILVSADAARQVEGYVLVETLGARAVRGRAAPVGVARVLGEGVRRSRVDGDRHAALVPFVGRQRELDALAALMGDVRAGRGQVVGVVGEPGIGKTRLLREFGTKVGESVTLLEGRCVSYGSTVPWFPVADLLRARFGVTPGMQADVVGRRVTTGLAELGLERDADLVAHLLGAEAEGGTIAGLSPEAFRARTEAALREIVIADARRRAVVLVVEDLHWVDQVSEQFLMRLVDAIAASPVLLVTTFRPGYGAPWVDRSHATQIALRPLPDADAEAIVRAVLAGGDQTLAIADAVDRGDGNPFFLEEIARALRENPDTAPTEVPDTVEDVLLARLDRLTARSRGVLEAACVLGREFSLRLLREHVAEDDLDGVIEDLVRQEFLVRGGREERSYAFKHALTQDVAYEALLERRRRALHAAAASAIECLHGDNLDEVVGELAHHWSQTDDTERAVAYLLRAAERAARTYGHREATEALERALQKAGGLPTADRDRTTVEIVLRLVRSLYFLGRFDDSLALLRRHEQTLQRLGDARLSGPYRAWLAHTHSHAGHSLRAAECVSQALETARVANDPLAAGLAHYVLAREGIWLCRFGPGVASASDAVTALRRAGDWWWRAHAHCFAGFNLCQLGRFDDALLEIHTAHALGVDHADPRLQSYSRWGSGWVHATRGDWQAGVRDCTESLETSPDVVNSSYSMGWLGFAYREQGDFQLAVGHLERSIALLEGFNYHRLVGWFTAWLSEAYLELGEIERARDSAYRAAHISRRVRFPWSTATALRALGKIAERSGSPGAARRHLAAASAAFEAMHARFEVAVVKLLIAELAATSGDGSLAVSEFDAVAGMFDRMGAPRWAERSRQCGDTTQRGPPWCGGPVEVR